MTDESNEGKKTTVLSRMERLHELIEEDAPALLIEAAFNEVGRELDGLIRPGRGQGDESQVATVGESPPSL
jgi:hypothetical protein